MDRGNGETRLQKTMTVMVFCNGIHAGDVKSTLAAEHLVRLIPEFAPQREIVGYYMVDPDGKPTALAKRVRRRGRRRQGPQELH